MPEVLAHSDVLAVACISLIAVFVFAQASSPAAKPSNNVIPYDAEWTLIEAHFLGEPVPALRCAEGFVCAQIQRAGVSDTAILQDYAAARALGFHVRHGLATAEDVRRAMALHRSVVGRLSRARASH